MEATRVVELGCCWDDPVSPPQPLGSGFVINDGFVMTAAHNLAASPDEERPRRFLIRGIDDEEWTAADVRMRSEALDLAVLTATTPALDPVRIGQVDRKSGGVIQNVWAAGFPRFKDVGASAAGGTEVAQPAGAVHVLADRRSHNMTLDVYGGGPGPQAHGRLSPWAGLSGAGVVFDVYLIGIVTEHHVSVGPSAVYFVPLARLGEEPHSAEQASVCEILGIGYPPALPVVNRQEDRPRARAAPATLSPPAAEVEAAFRRWMRKTHGEVAAFFDGVEVRAPVASAPMPDRLVNDGSSRFARRQEVAEADRAAAAEGTEASAMVAGHPHATFAGPTAHIDRVDIGSWPALSVDELVQARWRSVMLGDPGSGKTTIARRIAYDAAAPPDDRGHGPVRLPVLCRAVDLIDGSHDPAPIEERAILAGWLGDPPAAPESGDPLDRDLLRSTVQRAVAARSLLLIVDGLDEVTTIEQRKALAAEIDDFVTRAGACTGLPSDTDGPQVLATSRVVGYHLAPLDERFEQRWIAPLGSETSRALGAYWLRAHADAVEARPEATAELEAMLDARLAEPSLRDSALTSNPLLLTSLVGDLVRTGGAGALGSGPGTTRADLFDSLLDSFLDRVTARDPTVDRELLRSLQCSVAYLIHADARTGLIGPAELPALVGRATAAAGRDDLEPSAALRLVLAVGLLTERGQDAIGFQHLTVEEHLAGRWLDERSPDGEGLAAHLGDPRWVEPIRLALGHVSRSDPVRLRRVLGTLMASGDPRTVASLLGASRDDLVALDPADVGAIVTSLVADEDPGGDLGELAEPFFDAGHRAIGRQGRLHALRALTSAIEDERAPVMARGAAIAASLRLTDREILDALFEAQHRDGPEYGWPTVRALVSRVSDDGAAAGDRDPVDSDVADKLEQARRQLTSRARAVRLPKPADAGPSLRPPGLSSSRLPFRQALIDEPALVHTIESDPGWGRLVLLLYGGTRFADHAHWRDERDRLVRLLRSATATRGERLRAARQLDAVVEPTLQSLPESQSLDPELIAIDSPLTQQLLTWLRAEVDGPGAAERLWTVHEDGAAEDALRADALVGWLAATPSPTEAALAEFGRASSGSLGDRVRWRLARSGFLVADALARLPTDAIARYIQPVRDSGPFEFDPMWHVLLATAPFGAVRPLPLDDPSGPPNLAAFVGANAGFELAVALDTAGRALTGDGGDRLLEMLDEVRAIGATVTGSRWPLDPLAPSCALDPAEVLRAIAALPPYLDFMRFWLIGRLSGHLAAHGLAGAARSLVSQAGWNDPHGAAAVLERLAAAEREAEALPDAARIRAAIEIAARRRTAVDDDLVEEWRRHCGPNEEFRVAEVAASLGVAGLGDASVLPALAAAVQPAAERARAQGRLQRIVPPSQRDEVLAECLESLAETAPADRALILTGLPDADNMQPSTRHRRERIVRDLPSARLRALADGLVATPLLEIEGLVAREQDPASGERHPAPFDWTVLTAAALCHDVEALRPGRDAIDWDGLLVPARRDATLQALRAPGAGFVMLDDEAASAIDRLLQGGDEDVAAELLARVVSDRGRPELSSWRASPARRVADRASLLMLERGEADADAAEALVRLLTDSDDRVRLRAQLASAGIARGRGWIRSPFRCSDLGPRGLAALASGLVEMEAAGRVEATDLGWSLSDVVVDDPGVVTGALALLDDHERSLLLGSIRQVVPEAVAGLIALFDDLGDAERLRLLRTLSAIAAHPDRNGASAADCSMLADAAQTWAASGSEPVAAAAAILFGIAATPVPENVDLLIGELARDDLVSAGACHGVGWLLARAGGGKAPRGAIDALWSAARTGAGPLGVAAVGALVRAGEGVEDPDRPKIDPRTLVWGLIAGVDDFVMSDESSRGLRRAADYVVDPPGRAGDERTSHTQLVMGDLLRRFPEMVAAASRRSFDPDPLSHWWLAGPDSALVVVAELAARQPAVIRTSFAGRDDESWRRLCAISRSPFSWFARLGTARLIALLGTVDATAAEALLAAAADTAPVREAMSEALPYVERVEPDALLRLLEASRAARPVVAHTAISLLTTLLETGALTLDQRRAALGTLEEATARSGGSDEILVEVEGSLESLGTVGEAAAHAIRRLSTSDVSAGDGVSVGWFDVPSPAGDETLSLAVAAGTPSADPIRFQRMHLEGSGHGEALAAVASELENAALVVRDARRSFASVLTAPVWPDAPPPVEPEPEPVPEPVPVPVPEPEREPEPEKPRKPDELSTLYVQGQNSFGDEIYVYIRLPLAQIEKVKEALATGTFIPSEHGEVIAAGRGKPTAEVKAEIGETEFMVYFEPNEATD